VAIGGSENDLILTGTGYDTALAGPGADMVTLADPDTATDIIDGGDGINDRLLLAVGYGTFTMTEPCGFEDFTGTADVDIIDWSSATTRVIMRGNGGADTVLAGSSLNDLVTVVGGATVNVNGGDGANDTLTVSGAYTDFQLTGVRGFEVFTGGDGADNVDWSDATVAVTMRGNGGNDTLRGGSAGDLITGGEGNDALYGNGGVDTIYGEGGVNHLTGGAGNDNLRGNPTGNNDYAHFSANPVPPRYVVRDNITYIVVTDTAPGQDGVDIVRGCPLANILGPYVP
jgi:Ca2+-binding RTX toxin-like protein